METVRLALELLQRIPPRVAITAETLKAQLEAAGIRRDLRTIQRQLKALCQHFDIECLDQDRPYGYRWKERAKGFSLPALGPQESLVLTLAEQQLRSLLPPKLLKSMEGFFAQARRKLGGKSSAELEGQWLKKIRVVSTTQPLLPPSIRPGILEAVSEALYANLMLHVEYKNATGQRNKSDVMPLGLAQQGARLYLVCRFDGFENERNLALHRIEAAKPTSLPFERPKNFDLNNYDGDGRFHLGDGRKVRLVFRITRSAGLHITESPLSPDQTVTEGPDHFDISATVVDSILLDHWLLGFGDNLIYHEKASPQRQPKSRNRGAVSKAGGSSIEELAPSAREPRRSGSEGLRPVPKALKRKRVSSNG
jgi:predicted DNA-binding transcriptional regulator YafY